LQSLRSENRLGEWFTAELGSREGCRSFHCQTEATECNAAANGVMMHRSVVKDVHYADDVDQLTEKEVELQ